MIRKIHITVTLVFLAACLVVITAPTAVLAQTTDPRPYAAIANPLPDTLDQLYRDSVTIQIGRVRVNQAGYRPADDKFFYYVGSGASSFTVIDAGTGATVDTGPLASKNTNVSSQMVIRASNNAQRMGGGDTRYIMESQPVSGPLYEGRINVNTPGQYRIRVGTETSGPFWIHENVYGWVRDAALKFPGVNRCGNTNSWFHGPCHLFDATPGGWHDCGDHLKEGITQSYLHVMLALASAALRDHDVDNYGRNHNDTRHTDGIPDVLYEAKHGSDYILAAYDNANGDISRMVTSVANFGHDHSWWGQPEYQDGVTRENGGPPREPRVELGVNVLGYFAAGLAFTAKNYAVFDSAYAVKSIKVARELYEYLRNRPLDNSGSDAYSKVPNVNDKIAFAALGLLYATRERKYLDDLCYDKTLGDKYQAFFDNTYFEGGWFSYHELFSKGRANTDWGSAHMAVKWGFFRLILKDEQLCRELGLTDQERLKLIGRTVNQMINGIGQVPADNATVRVEIQLPDNGLGWAALLIYDDIWKYMATQMEWMWNRYQFGNIFDLYAYSDMAMWLEDEGLQLPGKSAGINWRGREIRQLMIRQVDYMLGVNPWDFSMIYGIGYKNPNHPHHRAANPEGKNIPGVLYGYRPPVGALHSGPAPSGGGVRPQGTTVAAGPGVYFEHFNEYHTTETGIDASATMIIPIMGLSREEPITGSPEATVRVVYVGVNRAIIEVRQTRFGMSTIRYAADGVTAFTSVKADSAGMFHQIELTGLSAGTKYNFDALVADMFGNSGIITDRGGELFTFTTLKTPPDNAEITNVKVCRVTSDSADIFWFTPNGSYDSRVVFGERTPLTAANSTVVNGNIYGRPSQFHYVKIGGLKEKTTYYFYVENEGVRDDNNGQYYTFTTPVEHVVFDVRMIRYLKGGGHFFAFNIVNQDIKDYDSLEFRIYVRAPDSLLASNPATGGNSMRAFENYIGFRVDTGVKYLANGYQGPAFGGDIDPIVQLTRAIRIGDTYNPADNTWAYYIPIPLGNVRMESGSRLRIDLKIVERSPWPTHTDLMNESPNEEFMNLLWRTAWTFSEHSRAAGDPVDYPGIALGVEDNLDDDYWNTPINQYLTVYRKNEFIWGYSPSMREQQTKKTHYEMSSLVTAPILNPSEEYFFMEQVVPSITVNGWAQVTENGVINDIWVNGNRVRDVNSVAGYDFASDRWNLTIPVPMRNGGNNVDITLFGGPDLDACATCYGCAFSNHSFYVEFKGAEPYPSTMRLESCANRSVLVTDTARIDETCFYIVVDDQNPSVNKGQRDTVYVTVLNPVLEDSLVVMLVETGDSTGIFASVNPISVVSAPPAQRGPNQISMDGGQTIWITYIDPTDSEDVSQMSLASRADFAVPVEAWFLDSAGIASINQVRVRFNSLLDRDGNRPPDSLHLTIPGQSDIRVVKAPQDGIVLSSGDRSVAVFSLNPAIENTTGFRSGEQMTARTFLFTGGSIRQAVVPVADSAGPALLDQALLFERIGTGYDTLQVILSEYMSSGNIIGNTLVHRRSGVDNMLAVVSVLDSSLLTNTLMLLVNPGGNTIREGDSVFINPIGSAVDRAGNGAHMQNRPVPIVLKSAAPRIVSAVYRDINADGIIDEVEIAFSKPLNSTGIRLSLSWGTGPFVSIPWDSLSANVTETVFRARISGLLTDSVLTVGTMRAMVTHNSLPNDTLRSAVADRAAPVIRTAQFGPALFDDDRDTLTVTFSEPVLVTASRPFAFLFGEDGTEYSMSLQNLNPRVSYEQKFLVNSVENTQNYPGINDSVWISVLVVTSDTLANIQSNANNRRVKLSIKPAPLAITIIPAPNPFTPGAKGAAGQPARIIVRPTSKSTADINLKGAITIYDRMGNAVVSDALNFDPNTQDLIYEWTGHNKKGRKAGTGTYLIKVSVEHVLESWEDKVKPVTGKTLIYLKR